mgnify:FL=1
MPTTSPASSGALPAILWGGLVAGTIDIGAASLISGLDPVLIMKIIAGGLLGKSAFHGDASVAFLGLLLQWAMSMLIAAIFVLAARRMPGLIRHWFGSGIAYGVVIYFVMNDAVLPLSAIGNGLPHFEPVKFCENMLAMLVFGLIVAFCAKRSMR